MKAIFSAISGWKTVSFNTFLVTFGTYFWDMLSANIPPQYILGGVGVIGIILRIITDSPVFKKAGGTVDMPD